MLDQEPFLEKTPLYDWMVAASYSTFGVSAWAARFPSILLGWGALWFTFALARCAFGEEAGLYASLVLGTLVLFMRLAHQCAVDDALVFFTTGPFYWLRDGSVCERKLPGYALAYLFALGAFLSKGPIGLALVGPAFLAFLAWTRNGREVWRSRPWLGRLIVGGGALLCVAALPPDLRHVILVDNPRGRFRGTIALAALAGAYLVVPVRQVAQLSERMGVVPLHAVLGGKIRDEERTLFRIEEPPPDRAASAGPTSGAGRTPACIT